MKVFAFCAIILSVCCSLSFASESIGFFKDPAHRGKCVYKNLILSPGEEAKLPETCGRMICGMEGFATIQTCGFYASPPGCKYTDYINIDAPYSKCCEQKLVC